MAGIPDMLTDIRTTGQGVQMGGQPPMGRPPMGGPPPGQLPMGRPPMGGGIASMGGGQPPMGQPPMGGGQPPMSMEEPPMEEPVSIEQDSAALAEAVVGRAQGDIGAAVAILDTAKAMLMQGGQEDPMMMMGGGPMYRNMGGPMYAQEGRAISDSDTDTLKQMIMNSVRENPMLNSEGANSISPMGYNVRTAVSQLGNDVLGMDPSDKDSQEAANAAIAYQMSLR